MNTTKERWAITGVLGYSGSYIAAEALKQGIDVLGFTNSTDKKNPNGLELAPLSWDDPNALIKNLHGCRTLVNTYWVRFTHGNFSHEKAIYNTRVLMNCAKRAGVERIIHISITHPSEESSLPYFHGKAVLEEYLRQLGVPYSILRPAVLFGETPQESILINNITWILRHLPAIGVFGKGDYHLQPIHVQDLAQLAVSQGMRKDGDSEIIQAVGPEVYTYRELLHMIEKSVDIKRLLIPVTPGMGYAAAKILGGLMGDVMLTKDEIQGLMEDRLAVPEAPPAGKTHLSEWVRRNSRDLGRHYASELSRRN